MVCYTQKLADTYHITGFLELLWDLSPPFFSACSSLHAESLPQPDLGAVKLVNKDLGTKDAQERCSGPACKGKGSFSEEGWEGSPETRFPKLFKCLIFVLTWSFFTLLLFSPRFHEQNPGSHLLKPAYFV